MPRYLLKNLRTPRGEFGYDSNGWFFDDLVSSSAQIELHRFVFFSNSGQLQYRFIPRLKLQIREHLRNKNAL